MTIHHVGYLVKKLDKAQQEFIKLGYTVERDVKHDPIRQINISFLVNGGYRVELVEPDSKESPMYPLLKTYKNAPYHFCYHSADLSKDVKELEENGYHVIQEKQEAPCIDGRSVVFLLSPRLGMIELVETPEGHVGF